MLTTPDLSKEFHPYPKIKKQRKPLNKIGKKTRNSLQAVKELKEIFFAHEITECELVHAPCWRNNALTFAHCRKRINLTPEQVRDPHCVALICTPGHMEIERLPEKEMERIVLDIVSRRGW